MSEEQSTVTIPLTQGYVAIIDAADYPLVASFTWRLARDEHRLYAKTVDRSSGKRRDIFMHVLLTNPPKGMMADHRDGDGLNNRRQNLRLASNAQNQQNRRPQGGTSAYKGVGWHKEAWRARIKVNGKTIHLGHFKTEQEAAVAYDAKAKEVGGEFARLNFPA